MIVREAATPISFIQQLTEKDGTILSGNRPMVQKLKDLANIITGRMSGFHVFNSPADYKPPFTFNLAGLANKWVGIGIGMIVYGKVAKDMKILPHGGYIGSIGKRLLTGGAVGGLFDAPNNGTQSQSGYVAPQPVEYSQQRVMNNYVTTSNHYGKSAFD